MNSMTNIEFFKSKNACEDAFQNYITALDRVRRLKINPYISKDGAPEYSDWLFHPVSMALKIRIRNDAGAYVIANKKPGIAKYHVPSYCDGTEWPVFTSLSVADSSGQQITLSALLVEKADLPSDFYSITINALIDNIREGRESEQSIARILSAIQNRRDR